VLGYLGLAAVLFVVVFAPILHWTRTDAGFFDRTPISHTTWKWLWIGGVFTGTVPLIGLVWWYFVVRDRINQPVGVSQT
jgi:hypothetical protein